VLFSFFTLWDRKEDFQSSQVPRELLKQFAATDATRKVVAVVI